MKTNDGKPTHCGCGKPLLDTITTCSAEGCDCKFIILTCQACQRAWGFDFVTKAWVELEEVKDDES
jgi:hypothetical protein